MNRLGFVLKSRGVRNSVGRAISVGRRFGFSESGLLRRLDYFSRVVGEFGATPSFSISTILLERYPDLCRKLSGVRADFLSHAHTHVDYAKLLPSEQRRLIGKSRTLLSACGRDPIGFRAPYLHWNDSLLEAIAENGFRFDSSSVAWWNLPAHMKLSAEQTEAYARARRFYDPFVCKAGTRGTPYFLDNGCLEIPVSLPDDEVMIDRLRLMRPSDLSRVWRSMLEDSYSAGSLLNLQLHPERIFIMAEPLRNLLKSARSLSPGVWITSLHEIHRWWRRKPPADENHGSRWPEGYRSALCISGDIDCATLQDFIWRFVE